MNHRVPVRGRVSSRLRAALPAVLVLAGGCVPTPYDAEPPGSKPTPEPRPAPAAKLGSPPALIGGTLLILRDGTTAVAADPDRDSVFVVDLASERLRSTLLLNVGDEPGRVVQGAGDLVFVTLRRGGAVLSLNARDGKAGKRQAVCAAPRGIAFDPAGDVLHVACAGGELVSLAGDTLTELRRVQLDRDLRDVVVSGDHLYVSRFRSAEVLRVKSADLSLLDRMVAPGSQPANQRLLERPNPMVATPPAPPTLTMMRAAEPSVAWRMRPLAGGGAVMLHQESSNGELGTEGGGYGGGPCKSPMGAAVVEFHDGAAAPTTSGHLMFTALPIDFDVSPDRKNFAMISAGGAGPLGTGPVLFGSMSVLFQQGSCVVPPPPDEVIEFRRPTGEAVAVAFDGQGRLVAQTREPARLEILTHKGGSIKMSDISRADEGHKLFHQMTGSGLACASCHPEGGDDGRVWRFAKIGARRTQNLLGGIAMTAPFHWDGDMKTFNQLMQEVFTGRMQGPQVSPVQIESMNTWLDRQPAVPESAPRDPAAVARGKALFHDAKVACATCHVGPLLTDNSNRLVGTGSMLQVPSLRGVAARAPFMHDGCAKTMMDRFDVKCGGGDLHGVTSHLAQAELQDLVAYLESL
jgi:YD repeat-containing protein